MLNDPIVEEMRAYGMAFSARHGNDIGRMCAALKEKERRQGREVVQKSKPTKRNPGEASHRTLDT
uniref:Uncharacterized protein n=1 Tax=Candidatus Kentrum sp. SD TaxID=2126332 RepID=A0A451BKM2_9GAMM|nr:MAG: hypothetical protein BECKSD772D_GA0070982_102418 [Candidatus Kentron sp. SD]